MNKRRLLVISTALVLGLTSTSLAQEAAPARGLPLTLGEARELAFQNRLEARIDHEQVRWSESKVRESLSAFWPTLDFTGQTYRIKNYDSFSGINVSAVVAGQPVSVSVDKKVPLYEVNSALELDYNLYAGGRDSAVYQEASARLEVSRYQEQVTGNTVLLEVTTAYWQLRRAQLSTSIARRNLDYSQARYLVTSTRRDAGQISALDKEIDGLRVKEDEMALSEARLDQLNALVKYQQVLGMPGNADSEEGPALVDDPAGEDLVAGMAGEHPELKRLKADVTAAEARIGSAKSEYYPRLDLFAKYGVVGRDNTNYTESLGDLKVEYYTIGLRFTANLFSGFSTREKIRQASSEASTARMRLELRRRELAGISAEKQVLLKKAQNNLLLAEERLKLENSRGKMADTQFEAGKYSELEYRQYQVTTQAAADRLLMGKIDVALAQVALRLALVN